MTLGGPFICFQPIRFAHCEMHAMHRKIKFDWLKCDKTTAQMLCFKWVLTI